MATDKKFHDFPRPTVAVDTALLTIDDQRHLVVLEMARKDTGTWALPGTFLRKGETLAQAVERSLKEKVGVIGVKPRQLQVFDAPDRDDRDWVISVAHVVVVRPDSLPYVGPEAPVETRLAPVDRPGDLAWDHLEMIALAAKHVRDRYRHRPDPDRLLSSRFTLRELQRVHEAVESRPLNRDRFRRLMEPQLEDTGLVEVTGGRGRPATVFRRRRSG